MDSETMIRFRDVSWPIKVAVVCAWAVGIVWLLAFVIGFTAGLMGY